jgi:hypothetical protein
MKEKASGSIKIFIILCIFKYYFEIYSNTASVNADEFDKISSIDLLLYYFNIKFDGIEKCWRIGIKGKFNGIDLTI